MTIHDQTTETALRIVVMGVSGCGKSTVGAGLAKALGLTFTDGDSLHSAANIAKMRSGEALNDSDRAPWLAQVSAAVAAGGVVACSALKRRYRDQIRAATDGPVLFLHLTGTPDVLSARIEARTGHFMPVALLASQVATLEPLAPDEPGVTLDSDAALSDVINAALAATRA